MSSLLIVGDLHLGKGLNLGKQFVGSSLNSRVIDQLNLLDWVFDQAELNNIKHIILTGDVFDEPKPHYNLVLFFIDWLKKCSEYSISVHIIVGNHDILRSGQFTSSALDIVTASEISGVFVYKKINTLHLENIGITFLPFRDRRSFNTDINSEAIKLLKQKIPYEASSINNSSNKILIGHFALEGSIPVGYELDELSNELFCPLDMFNCYDYVWMGHIHKFQIMSENPHIAHIGSLDISDFGESEHKKYVAIFDAKQENKVNYIEIPTRNLTHLIIQVPELEPDVNQFIDKEISKLDGLKNSIVKLTIMLPDNSPYSINRNDIEKQLNKAGVFHISRISEERKFISLKKQIAENLDNSVNELSAIKTYSTIIDENIREDFVNLASSIVQEYRENI